MNLTPSRYLSTAYLRCMQAGYRVRYVQEALGTWVAQWWKP